VEEGKGGRWGTMMWDGWGEEEEEGYLIVRSMNDRW